MVDRIAWIAAVPTVTMTITSQTHAQRRTPNIDRIANEGTVDQALETLQSAHGK